MIFGEEVKPPLDELVHYGVKGMRWGVRKEAEKNFSRASTVVGARQDQRRLNASLTEAEFKRLNSKDVVIKKGSVIKRTSASPTRDETYQDLFVSTNERDARNYRALVPTEKTGGFVGRKHEGYYETTFKAVNDLRSPSEKERVSAYIRLMDVPAVKMTNGESVTGKEYLRRQGLGQAVDHLTSRQLALAYYGQLVVNQGFKDEPLNSAYFKMMRDRGYNALIDDNDRKILADEPLLVFDAKKNLEKAHVKQLTTKEVHQAQAELRLPGESD
jgi:hypothetical protein